MYTFFSKRIFLSRKLILECKICEAFSICLENGHEDCEQSNFAENTIFSSFGNVYTTGKINENSVFQAQLETKQNRATKWTKSVPVCCKNFQKMTELKRNKSYQSYVKTMVIEKKKNVFSMNLVLETDWPFVWGYHWLWHCLTLFDTISTHFDTNSTPFAVLAIATDTIRR